MHLLPMMIRRSVELVDRCQTLQPRGREPSFVLLSIVAQHHRTDPLVQVRVVVETPLDDSCDRNNNVRHVLVVVHDYTSSSISETDTVPDTQLHLSWHQSFQLCPF